MTTQVDHMLLWFDLETTGLDEQTDSILEVGWGLTGVQDLMTWVVEPISYVIDQDLALTRDGATVRKLGGALSNTPGPWSATVNGREVDTYVTKMHLDSGLWADMIEPGGKITLGKAEQAICSVLDGYSNTKFSMAGSGVSQFDMRWVRHHMPDLHAMLTYYSIDLGTYERVDTLLRGAGIRSSRGAADHRAVGDIEFAHRLALAYRAFLLTGTQFDRNNP